MGLREIKKHRLKQLIQRETLRLVDEQGYEKTTVEQIAEAAEVSTTTFYRYYSSKEDVILSGPYDPPPGTSLLSGLEPGETVISALRKAVSGTTPTEAGEGAEEGAREELLARLRLIYQFPELHALHAHRLQEGVGELARVLAGPIGADPESYEVLVAAAVVAAAFETAMRYWADHNGEPDLSELVDRALATISQVI